MRNTFIISIILLLFLVSCNKNKYNTTPSLKFKSVNTTQLYNLQLIQFTLSFTDKEGDFSDSAALTVMRKSLNCNAANNFTSPYPIPSFPTGKNQSGDLLVTFKYGDVSNMCPGKNDSSIFKFVLKDKAQHKSDTVVSPIIIIH